MKTEILQDVEILQDISKTGKIRPWKKHKLMNEKLSLAYDDVNKSKAARLRHCATQLAFVSVEGGLKLRTANFCRVRLCPMCSWRRALKVSAHMTRIMDAIKADREIAYIMLTLTVKNCEPYELDSTLDKLNQGYKRFFESKLYKGAVLGYYKAIEVTHNIDEDTYHPHIHTIFAVNKSYFTSRDYVSQERWTLQWQRSMRLNYTPVVHVQKIKGNTAKAVAEIAKYTLKVSEYILLDDWDMTVDTVRLLDAVLANRRLVGFGGIFREYHKRLNLDDVENGDLVHIDGDEPRENDEGRLIHFAWYSGYRQYYKIER